MNKKYVNGRTRDVASFGRRTPRLDLVELREVAAMGGIGSATARSEVTELFHRLTQARIEARLRQSQHGRKTYPRSENW